MNQERLLKIIVAPHVSEKSTLASEKNNVYVIKVVNNAKKAEVKAAVELLFKTKVSQVRLLNVRAKTKLFKGVEGKRSGYKKAYVTLQPNEKLELTSA